MIGKKREREKEKKTSLGLVFRIGELRFACESSTHPRFIIRNANT